MKPLFILMLIFFASNSCFSQFEKNEKLIGGSLNYSQSKLDAGSFGNDSKEKNIIIQPEFGYVISKNLLLSILGSISSQRFEQEINNTITKGRGYTVGMALTKYKFFTKGFGLFLKLEGSYSPFWSKFYFGDGTSSPKEKYYLTNVNLSPGLFYRFSKHFSLQTVLGHVSYEHLVHKRDQLPDSEKRDQFSAGFYSDVRLTAFYIFK